MLAKLNKRNWIKAAAVMLLLLAVAPLVLAQAGQEEWIIIIILDPPNDNFANASTLVLNQRMSHLGLLSWADEEPLEATDVDLTSCNMYNTLWWKFTSPYTGRMALSTAGSQFRWVNTNYWTSDTKMAVYTGTTLSNLTQVACSDDHSNMVAEIDDLTVVAGTTYYVRVGTFSSTEVAEGTLKVIAVITNGYFDPVGLVNGAFSSPISSGWRLKNAFNGDSIVAGQFKFVGGLFEATKLIQTRLWPIGLLKARDGHELALEAQIATSAGANLKMQLTINYSDGTPSSKRSLKTTAAAVMHGDRLWLSFASPNVKSIKVQFVNKAASGNAYVDGVQVYYGGGLLREALALPLP